MEQINIEAECSICHTKRQMRPKSLQKAIKRRGKYECQTCISRANNARPEVVAKIRAANQDPSRRAASSVRSKALWNNHDYRARVSKSLKLMANSDTGKRQRQKQATDAWRNPEYAKTIKQSGIDTHFTPDFTPEIRAKLRATTLKNWQNPELAAKYIEGSAKGYVKACGIKKSKPHTQVEGLLDDMGVKYVSEYRIGKYFADIYIIKLHCVIEVNGDYWHNLPHKILQDAEKRAFIESMGDKVYYIWEHELEDQGQVKLKLANILQENACCQTIA